MNKRKILVFLKGVIVPSVFLTLSIFGCLSCLLLKNFKIDYLSFQMIDYNKVLGNSEYDSPILSVSKTEEKVSEDGTPFYDDLFYTFHYNMLIKGSRTVVDSRTSILLNDSSSSSFELTLTTQPTFAVDKTNLNTEGNPIYHIDCGQYYSYFPEIVSRHRGSTNMSFMYISDTLANKIVETLNIPGETIIEKYEKLVTDENFCYQNLIIDDSFTAPVAINNIIHTDYNEGQSKRFFELYGDYSVIWAERIKKNLSVSFEMDLKTNPYGNKKVIETIEKAGYVGSNSKFRIKTLVNDTYQKNEKISSELTEILTTKFTFANFLPFIIVQITSFVFCFLIHFKKIFPLNNKRDSLAIFALFFIFGLVVSFTYNFPLFSVTPLVFMLFWFASLYLAGISNEKHLKESQYIGAYYYEIEI